MALQRIVLIINKKSAIDVKNILYDFNSAIPKINIVRRLSDDELEIEFKVPLEICERIIRKFVSADFTVKPIDEITKKILFQTSYQIKDSEDSYSKTHSKKSVESSEKSKKVKELSEIVHNFLNGKRKINSKNQEELRSSINLYIDKLRKDAYFYKSRAYTNIQELLEIATNKKLNSSALLEIAKSAGFTAITISAERSQNVGELINICNNRSVHCAVNVKAAAKFSKIAFTDEDLYKTDILIAVKRLNTRWLSTIWDEAGKDLTFDEIENFQKLQSFIAGKNV